MVQCALSAFDVELPGHLEAFESQVGEPEAKSEGGETGQHFNSFQSGLLLIKDRVFVTREN